MSIACGNCHGGGEHKLVCLYRLDGEGGNLQYPSVSKHIIPPNSLVCEKCLAVVPTQEKYKLSEGQAVAGVYFCYTPAEESSQGLCGVITQEAPENFTFIKEDAVREYLAGAMEIIQAARPRQS